MDRQLSVGFREEHLAAHQPPAGHGGEPYWHLGVLLDDEVLPAAGLARPPALDSHDVEGDLAHRHGAEAVRGRDVVEDARLDNLPRDYLLLARLKPPQELVHGAHPLFEAAHQALPVRSRDDAGDPIRRMGLVTFQYSEGILLLQQQPVRPAQLLLPLPGTRAPQLVEDEIVDPARPPVS